MNTVEWDYTRVVHAFIVLGDQIMDIFANTDTERRRTDDKIE